MTIEQEIRNILQRNTSTVYDGRRGGVSPESVIKANNFNQVIQQLTRLLNEKKKP